MRYARRRVPLVKAIGQTETPATNSPDLMRDEVQPYFLWWLDCTVADLKRSLADPDPEKRAYFLGALLREANTRDVWLFTTPEQVHREWPRLVRHLGRARKMWAWLIGLPEPEWPPREARRAEKPETIAGQ